MPLAPLSVSHRDPRAPTAVDRRGMLDWFRRNRARSARLFDLVTPDAYLARPIPLRHPIVFYEGHLPVFTVNTVVKKGLGRPGLDARFEVLFARGIDPADEAAAAARSIATWPAREAILEYGRNADRIVAEAIERAEIARDDHPLLRGAQAVYASLEHEAMHQETLLYIFHRLPYALKHAPADARTIEGGDPPTPATVRIAAGTASLGTDLTRVPFGWDNELCWHAVEVPEFEIDVYNVTNRDYLKFVEAGGYDDERLWTPEGWNWRAGHDVRHPLFWERQDGRWLWRGMFEHVPLPPAWPVYVSHAEASAFARWRGKRLPTEAEFHRAAYGAGSGEERSYPWGDGEPDETRGNFDFRHWDPMPVGSCPAGASAWGVHDLVGNGWEWTSTVFQPFDGFQPLPSYPEYSADFFDEEHYVMKGASPATARELLRPGFRNWFRATYPYVYATFRLVAS
jgi:iron(II)-dependent oxidoreductase